MKFDIAIGNPPYQENDGGGQGTSAKPIYNLFVQHCCSLANHLVMIIPARWYCGGKGLDDFRTFMLYRANVVELYDFDKLYEIFDTVKIPGGICYFHIDNTQNKGLCRIHNRDNIADRRIVEQWSDCLIRSNKMLSILNKIVNPDNYSFDCIVSERKSYGLSSDALDNEKKYGLEKMSTIKNSEDDIRIIGVINNKREYRYVSKEYSGIRLDSTLDKYKVFLSKAISSGINDTILRPFIGLPNDICTETYLVIGSFDTKEQAENCISYINTKFFHACLLSKVTSQNISKSSFNLIPMQDFNESWADDKLYKNYGLYDEDILYIESSIRDIR